PRFFFSSRRRHTRFSRDWSSDVCSSDLKGYEVHGIIRRASLFNTDRIDHLYKDPHDPEARMFLHYGDLSDATNLRRILEKVRPDEVYNLGAQSHVKVSFEEPEYTADIVATGTLRLLEAVRD